MIQQDHFHKALIVGCSKKGTEVTMIEDLSSCRIRMRIIVHVLKGQQCNL